MTWLNAVAGAAARGLLIAVLQTAWPFVRDTATWLATAVFMEPVVADAATRVAVVFHHTVGSCFSRRRVWC